MRYFIVPILILLFFYIFFLVPHTKMMGLLAVYISSTVHDVRNISIIQLLPYNLFHLSNSRSVSTDTEARIADIARTTSSQVIGLTAETERLAAMTASRPGLRSRRGYIAASSHRCVRSAAL